MKTSISIITLSMALIVMLCSCSGGSNANQSSSVADDSNPGGILAPLAKKYIEIADNNLVSEKALDEIKANHDDSALKKAEKICNEIKQKNDVLVDEAKSIAEKLKGQSIECSPATCTIYGVKATSKSANVVLAFAGASEGMGCVFQDSDGKAISKMKTFVNGDGTIAVIYVLGTKNNAKTAREAARIAKIVLVPEAEYNSVVVPE